MKDFFGKLLSDNIETFAQGATAGIEAERRHWLTLLDAIFVTYRRALADPKVVIPTPLHAALADAQLAVGEIREAQARADEERKAHEYSERMIRKDQRLRIDGDESHDLDLVGRAMKAGW